MTVASRTSADPLGPDSLTWKYFGDLRTGMTRFGPPISRRVTQCLLRVATSVDEDCSCIAWPAVRAGAGSPMKNVA